MPERQMGNFSARVNQVTQINPHFDHLIEVLPCLFDERERSRFVWHCFVFGLLTIAY